MIYCIDWNNRGYQRFKKAYNLLSDYDRNPDKYPDGPTDEFHGRYSASFIRNLRNNYRRNRDLCIILSGALYVLQIVDAHVDAHLKDYDISDDLSMNLEPLVDYTYVPTSGQPPGVRLQFEPEILDDEETPYHSAAPGRRRSGVGPRPQPRKKKRDKKAKTETVVPAPVPEAEPVPVPEPEPAPAEEPVVNDMTLGFSPNRPTRCWPHGANASGRTRSANFSNSTFWRTPPRWPTARPTRSTPGGCSTSRRRSSSPTTAS